MQSLNILVIGTDETEKIFLEASLKSKFLDKIYTASKEPIQNIPNIEYENFEELVKKSKALHIDIAITADKQLIKSGIADTLKKYGINIVALNKKWANLESRIVAKNLAAHYSINVPEIIKAPTSFPVVIKTDTPDVTQIAYSMNDLIEKKSVISNKKHFLEECLDGEIFHLLSLWDGMNITNFQIKAPLTEVQIDRLELYKTKLNFMLSDEKADFIGFFTSKLLWAKNDWYLLEYIPYPSKKSALSEIKTDFLYLLNLAIYQKLNEI